MFWFRLSKSMFKLDHAYDICFRHYLVSEKKKQNSQYRSKLHYDSNEHRNGWLNFIMLVNQKCKMRNEQLISKRCNEVHNRTNFLRREKVKSDKIERKKNPTNFHPFIYSRFLIGIIKRCLGCRYEILDQHFCFFKDKKKGGGQIFSFVIVFHILFSC